MQIFLPKFLSSLNEKMSAINFQRNKISLFEDDFVFMQLYEGQMFVFELFEQFVEIFFHGNATQN